MRLLRRKCTFLLDILGLTLLFVLGCMVVFEFWSGPDRGVLNTFLSEDPREVSGHALKAPRFVAVALTEGAEVSTPNERCTLSRCFDVARCRHGNFKVYVYPDAEGRKVSPIYQKILRVLRSSSYYTSDPAEACLFVPSWDTLDRDKLSENFGKNIPQLSNLQYWNDGRNHLIFNFYSGSWPDYSETLDFDTGKAILAKTSFNVLHYRPGFDVSVPLVHESLPERGGDPGKLSKNAKMFPIRRKYLLAFKGKRYVYGVGSETRSSLYHLHNGKDMILVTTCKHNMDWKKHQDDRCIKDNELYDRYDYTDLLINSTFCLVPRGRRLGSFRFLEALQASCIPVSMSNGYVLPFQDVIDWKKAALTVEERQLLQVPHVVRSVPSHKLLSMRLHTQFLWETYFNSIEKIITTTLEVIRNRLQPRSAFAWNRRPGGLAVQPDFSPHPRDYPFYSPLRVAHRGMANYTAVITCTRPAVKGTSPLVRLVKSIATAPHLHKIVILWAGSGPPRISIPDLGVPIVIQQKNLRHALIGQFWPLLDVETDGILHLNENVELAADEAEFGFTTWRSFPDRLVGFVGHKHFWDPVHLQWGYTSRLANEFSLVLTGAMFYHRYYGYLLSKTLPPAVRDLADRNHNCLDIAMNFMVSQVTRRPPIKATHKKELSKLLQETSSNVQKQQSDRVSCLNMIVNAYGYVPLQYSAVRLDPVLFKDNVSMLRKEYRKLEVI